MTKKSIKKIIPSQKVNMGGHILDQPLPIAGINQIDPFLLIHHWDHPLPGGQKQKDVGVGAHPHRGFSPVTFVFKGSVQHRDSLGNDAIVEAGGTQWMHAGRGITHSERPGADLAENGGENEFIQFWVNTPAKFKFEQPYYLPISDEETPKVKGEKYSIGVVAGKFENVKGIAKTYSPMVLLRGNIESGGEMKLNLPSNQNCLLYLLDGKLKINEQEAKAKDLIWFNQDGETIEVSAIENTRFIVLSGEPINEEVASYGPFVMNNQTEIMQAIKDAQMGKMGVLIEEFF